MDTRRHEGVDVMRGRCRLRSNRRVDGRDRGRQTSTRGGQIDGCRARRPQSKFVNKQAD